MTKPIVLYDQNHERVGETYPRRAKQLVRSGRAAWLEEGQSLIIDTEYMPYPPKQEEAFTMNETIYQNNGQAVEEPTHHERPEAPHSEMPNDLLLYLARKNVAEKKSLLRHVIAYIAAWPILHIFVFRYLSPGSVSGEQATATVHMLNEFVPRFRQIEPSGFGRIPMGHYIEGPFGEIIFNINEAVQAATPAANTGQSNLWWYFIMGVLITWGVFIAARAIKILRRHMSTRTPRPAKPDPVSLEYQRLKASM